MEQETERRDHRADACADRQAGDDDGMHHVHGINDDNNRGRIRNDAEIGRGREVSCIQISNLMQSVGCVIPRLS